MPFDPNKFITEHQEKMADAPSTSGGGFDPQAFIQAHGVETLPNKGNIQNGASTANDYRAQFNNLPGNPGQPKIDTTQPLNQPAQPAPQTSMGDAAINSATAGASLGGLGRDLAPFVSAIFPTAMDKVKGNDYFDRVLTDKANQDKSYNQTTKDYPVLSLITQGAAAVPKQLALSEMLGKIGFSGMPNQAGVIGALEALTQSKKQSMLQMAGDTVEGGAIAYLSGLALNKYANLLKSPQMTSAVDELGMPMGKPPTIEPLNPESVISSAKPRPNGDFEIKVGKPSMVEAYTLGKEESKLLTDPDLRATVTDRMNDVFGTTDRPGDIPNLIQKTKKSLGAIRDPLIKQYGAAPTNTLDPLKKAWDFANTFNDGGNDVYGKALSNFKDYLKQVEFSLRSTSPTSALEDVPLHSSFNKAQDIGDAVFGKTNLYRAAPPIKKAAQDLYFGLRDAAAAGDKSGQVKTLGEAFSTLYKMDANADLSGDMVSRLNNPDKGAARAAYQDFIKPLKEFHPDNRAALMPELQEYIATELPARLNAKATVDVANSTSDSKGAIGWLLNKIYINNGTLYKASGAAGAAAEIVSDRAAQLSNAVGSGVDQGIGQVGSGLETGLQSLQRQMSK